MALREAREARGLSYAEVERETRIPRHNLQALEEERFDTFSAPVYVRGFLRSYSQFLRLDGSELIAKLPPDRPVEEERLPPLSRLGPPRGPREAARARRSPVSRDAPVLTEAELRRSALEPEPEDEEESVSGRMRLSLDSLSAQTPRPRPRLDPLGRIGWPSRLDEEPPAMTWAEPQAQEPVEEQPAAVRRPLAQVESRPAAARARPRPTALLGAALPDDVRPLFSRQALTGIALILGLLAVFYGFVLAVGGGDQSPAIFAASEASNAGVAATPAVASQASVTVPSAPSNPRGSMPDLQGRDLPSALDALKNQGITPIVIEQSNPDIAAGQVLGQAPAPGQTVRSDTPVLIVLNRGR